MTTIDNIMDAADSAIEQCGVTDPERKLAMKVATVTGYIRRAYKPEQWQSKTEMFLDELAINIRELMPEPQATDIIKTTRTAAADMLNHIQTTNRAS